MPYPYRFGLNPDPANPGKYLQSGNSVPIDKLSSVPHDVKTGNTRLYYFAYEGRRLPEGSFSVLGHVGSPDRGDTVERFWIDPSAQFLTNFGQRVDATDAEIQIAQWISAYDPAWGYTTARRWHKLMIVVTGLPVAPGQ